MTRARASVRTELRAANSELPFRGRAESFQLFGVGRLSVAEQLCERRKLSPVAFDRERALFQLSVMFWKQSPVGAYCASFAGPVVTEGSFRMAPAPRAAYLDSRTLLTAFLRAPKALFVPLYAIADLPGAAAGGAVASRAFGQRALGIEKTSATFRVERTQRLTHLQVLEERTTETGKPLVSGFSLTVSAGRGGAAVRSFISPNLLWSRELYWESAKAMWQGGTSGVLFMPNRNQVSETIPIGTEFITRPRLHDLAADSHAAFTPLVLDRPAPVTALGGLLEAADFSPLVLAWDLELRGTILGPLERRFEPVRDTPLPAEQGAA